VLRQLLAATLCAVLALPACSNAAPLSNSTPNHIYDAATLSKTRVWGSNEKILLHFRATLPLSEKQHWSSAKCSCESAVGSVVTYDYDAFGNLLHQTGTTPNNYLFAGEQFDPDLGLYYNRARYLNTSTGRFWTFDTAEPNLFEPLSLHRYLYANGDAVNRTDASGEQASIAEADFEMAVIVTAATMGTVLAQRALQTVKSELSMRLNHYTQWIFLPLIMAGGIDSPSGTNFSRLTSIFLALKRSRPWHCLPNRKSSST